MATPFDSHLQPYKPTTTYTPPTQSYYTQGLDLASSIQQLLKAPKPHLNWIILENSTHLIDIVAKVKQTVAQAAAECRKSRERCFRMTEQLDELGGFIHATWFSGATTSAADIAAMEGYYFEACEMYRQLEDELGRDIKEERACREGFEKVCGESEDLRGRYVAVLEEVKVWMESDAVDEDGEDVAEGGVRLYVDNDDDDGVKGGFALVVEECF